jgi:hypothetical protein
MKVGISSVDLQDYILKRIDLVPSLFSLSLSLSLNFFCFPVYYVHPQFWRNWGPYLPQVWGTLGGLLIYAYM